MELGEYYAFADPAVCVVRFATFRYDAIFQPKTNSTGHYPCLRFIHSFPFVKLGFYCKTAP